MSAKSRQTRLVAARHPHSDPKREEPVCSRRCVTPYGHFDVQRDGALPGTQKDRVVDAAQPTRAGFGVGDCGDRRRSERRWSWPGCTVRWPASGARLLLTGHMYVEPRGQASATRPGLHDDRLVESMVQVTDAVRAHERPDLRGDRLCGQPDGGPPQVGSSLFARPPRHRSSPITEVYRVNN